MYGAEWLIGLGVLGLVIGLGCGYLLAARRSSGGRARQLEAELSAARQELDDYRHEVVAQFSETARKFQTLNDSYTDLHEQLAKSSSVLCGDLTGPLLEAPDGHQDLIPAEIRVAEPEAASGTSATSRAAATDTPANQHAPHATQPPPQQAGGTASSKGEGGDAQPDEGPEPAQRAAGGSS